MRRIVLYSSLLLLPRLQGADRKLPAEFVPIAQAALAAPPEFAADALLRLVESQAISDRDTAIDLTQQAFDLAASAHFRQSLRPRAGVPSDSRAGSLANAYKLNRDSLTLQSRAVQDLLPLHPARARQLFSAIPKPELPPIPCDAPFTYDVQAFYQALGAVVRNGFTAQEKAKDDPAAFLFYYAAQAHTSAQVAAMADVIQQSGLTPAQQEVAMVRLRTPEAVKPCKEDDAKPEPYWKSDAAQKLLTAARNLRYTPGASRVLSDAERRAPEWRVQLADFVKQLASWEPASEKSEEDYYQQKCLIYASLVELIPAGDDRDSVLNEFVSFIARSNLQQKSPVEWFLPAAEMLARVKATNDGEPSKVLAAYEASGNSMLTLHAALERLFASPRPHWASSQ